MAQPETCGCCSEALPPPAKLCAPLTCASPSAIFRYIGSKLNEHGQEQRKVHLHAEPEGATVGKQEGMTVDCIVDMDEKKLSFSLNGEEPIDCGITLPDAGVRPWVFMYHEGDSVTLEEAC